MTTRAQFITLLGGAAALAAAAQGRSKPSEYGESYSCTELPRMIRKQVLASWRFAKGLQHSVGPRAETFKSSTDLPAATSARIQALSTELVGSAPDLIVAPAALPSLRH